MNTSILTIVIGAFLLFIPDSMWLGLSIMMIGLVIHYLYEDKGKVVQRQRRAYVNAMNSYLPEMQMMQNAPRRPRSDGFAWDIKDPSEEMQDKGRVNKSLAQKSPYVDKGMFNLPLPMDPEIAELVDLKYQKYTGARGSRYEKVNEGLIPGFD